MSTSSPQRAAIYCRISDDREGEGLGVERQEEDCRARAEREGWKVVDPVFIDNDTGASSRSRKARPHYRQMLKLAQDGGIDVILAYSTSRLTRRPRELEDLIDIHDQHGVTLRTIVSGDVNLETAGGRMIARVLAARDASEAEENGERVARAARQRKQRGLFHGGRPPYGYVRQEKGKLALHPERAAVVREAATRVLNGESLYGVWTDFNRRGIPTGPSPRAPQGTRWQAQTLKRVLTTPASIGCVRLDTGELKPMADPILDRTTWDRLRELLFDPGRRAGTPPDWSSRRRFPLSGLLFCSECGHWLSGAALSTSPRRDGERRPPITSFACVTATGGCGKIRISYGPLEKWILDMVFARLDTPEVRDALSTRDERGDADELRQQITNAERRLERLDDDRADGLLDDHRYRRQVERLTGQMTELRSKLAELQRSVFVIDTGGKSLREVWAEHDPTWQRTLLGHLIDKIVIRPHPAGITTNLSRRRGENDETLAKRRAEHLELLMEQRVHVHWKQ